MISADLGYVSNIYSSLSIIFVDKLDGGYKVLSLINQSMAVLFNKVVIKVCTCTKLWVKSLYFIALIHPIQWTIALPVGATGPAKRQKKTSCIYYRQDRSQSVHSPGGASYFISCLPIDVIASFSFGAKECAEDFLQRYVFEVLQRTLPSFLFFISTE